MALLKPNRHLIASPRFSIYTFIRSLAAAASNQVINVVDSDPAFGVKRIEPADDVEDEETDAEEDSNYNPKWKRLVGPESGMYHGHIPQRAWHVLQTLRERGYASYLVGGCIRDSLLKQIPKDYDILTTAELKDVKSTFQKSLIVGRHFPVCHVSSQGLVVEVTSFSTVPIPRRPRFVKHNSGDCPSKEDILRCENTMNRDFTINAFMYDPFDRVLYDYVGGLADLEKKKVRTIIPPQQSFTEDPARLLRGIRIAGRLGFRFSRETSRAVKALKASLLHINQHRLMQELNTMMVYGAAAPSMRLLWKYEYLDIMLPAQAAYLERSKLKRSSKPRRNLLTDLLTVLDRFVSPDRPCHTSLWIALMAFQLALEEKRSHIGVTAAILAIRHQNMNLALRELNKFEAMLKEGKMTINGAYFERSIGVDDDNTIVAEALHIIEESISSLQQMHGSPDDPPSIYGTLISRTMYAKVIKFFQGARDRVRNENATNKRPLTEFLRNRAFSEGADAEVVHALSCIVLNTLYIATDKNVFMFR